MKSSKLRQSIIVSTGSGVRVAVLDSGLDPDFDRLAHGKGRSFVLEEQDGILESKEVPRALRTDMSGHGSCVQSCLIEVAPDAEVDHFRILDEFNNCPSRLLCLALDHVLSRGYHIINLSLGTRNEAVVPWLVSIMKRAYESDTCIVAASSNIGNSLYPGRFTYAISAAGGSIDDPLQIEFHPNNVVEFTARGVGVNVPYQKDKRVRVSGTSYASGYVAGICARVIETLGHSRPMEVKMRLRDYALALKEDTSYVV